jgi:hypothetical protein
MTRNVTRFAVVALATVALLDFSASRSEAQVLVQRPLVAPAYYPPAYAYPPAYVYPPVTSFYPQVAPVTPVYYQYQYTPRGYTYSYYAPYYNGPAYSYSYGPGRYSYYYNTYP